MSEKFVGLSTLFLKKKNKEKPEVTPENENTSYQKLYRNITYVTSKLYRIKNQSKEEKKMIGRNKISN